MCRRRRWHGCIILTRWRPGRRCGSEKSSPRSGSCAQNRSPEQGFAPAEHIVTKSTVGVTLCRLYARDPGTAAALLKTCHTPVSRDLTQYAWALTIYRQITRTLWCWVRPEEFSAMQYDAPHKEGRFVLEVMFQPLSTIGRPRNAVRGKTSLP